MINKTIHYCWFGKNPLPNSAMKCIESWKRFLPDYEIIEWNENNFNVNENQYAKEAYENKKYAFVSDYARLKILYCNGGVYFDVDVELIKPIPKKFLEEGYLCKEGRRIATGLGFACKKGDKTIKKMLDDYDNLAFIRKDGSFDEKPCPIRNTKSLRNIKKMTVNILSSEYANPYNYKTGRLKITNNTFSIHHYDASWWNKNRQANRQRKYGYIEKHGILIGKARYYIIRLFEKIRRMNG